MKKVLSRIALVLLVVVCSASAFMFGGCGDPVTGKEPTLKYTTWQYKVGDQFEDATVTGFDAKYFNKTFNSETQKWEYDAEATSFDDFKKAYDAGGLDLIRGLDVSTATEEGASKRTMVVIWQGEQFKVEYTVVAA